MPPCRPTALPLLDMNTGQRPTEVSPPLLTGLGEGKRDVRAAQVTRDTGDTRCQRGTCDTQVTYRDTTRPHCSAVKVTLNIAGPRFQKAGLRKL